MSVNPFLTLRTVKLKRYFKGLLVVTFQTMQFWPQVKTKEIERPSSMFLKIILRGGLHLCAVVTRIFQLELFPNSSRIRNTSAGSASRGVRRWGRFQDADESAYYEYICRRADIQVQYCAEQFENDGSPVATIVKGVKRAMAGEYSRELSVKVFAGQCRLIELGYRQGGPAGFGLRRVLIGENGDRKAELARGEHKSLQTDRVVLTPSPAEEVEIVRDIYRQFIEGGKSEARIAADLNVRGIRTDLGRDWTRGVVHQILTNEKYIGNNVYNRKSYKLKKKRVVNAPDMWIRADGVFEAIVDPQVYYTAQGIIRERNRR